MESPRVQLPSWLVTAHAGLIPNEVAMEQKWRKEMFGKVRILVVGRSGSGKTTLLRLVIGKEGPQTIAENGEAGNQDVNVEFCYKSEDGIPLIFHDTNGMSVTGQVANFRSIEEFLKARQSSDDFSEHVHVVWYVVSAVDNRLRDDGGLLTLLCDFDIPLLLVLTHTDVANEKMQVISKQSLYLLIDGTGADSRACDSMKASIIHIGNDVDFSPEDNRITINKLDAKGLEAVSKSTGELLKGDQMKATWAASQAAYTEMKLAVCAERIASYARRAALSTPAAVVPFTDVLKIGLLFKEVFSTLMTIWGVPATLKEVLYENLLKKECVSTICDSIASDAIALGGVAAAAVATAATSGASLIILIPSLVAWLGVSGLVNVRTAPILVKAFALQVVLNIQYVKCLQGSSRHRWDPELTKSQCEALCNELSNNVTLTNEIKEFAKSSHSTLDAVFRKKAVQIILKDRMDEIVNDILISRPTSFASQSGFGRN